MITGSNNHVGVLMRMTQLLVLSIIFCSGTIHANESREKDRASLTLETLMQERRSIKETSATFAEEKKANALKEDLHMEGKLFYRSPNYLLKLYTLPDKISYEATNDVIHIKNLEAATDEVEQIISIDRIPVLHAFITGLRGILGGNIKDVREFFQVDFSAKDHSWTIRLVPKDDKIRKQIADLLIKGENEQVLSIEIKETSGDSSITTIKPYNTINSSLH